MSEIVIEEAVAPAPPVDPALPHYVDAPSDAPPPPAPEPAADGAPLAPPPPPPAGELPPELPPESAVVESGAAAVMPAGQPGSGVPAEAPPAEAPPAEAPPADVPFPPHAEGSCAEACAEVLDELPPEAPPFVEEPPPFEALPPGVEAPPSDLVPPPSGEAELPFDEAELPFDEAELPFDEAELPFDEAELQLDDADGFIEFDPSELASCAGELRQACSGFEEVSGALALADASLNDLLLELRRQLDALVAELAADAVDLDRRAVVEEVGSPVAMPVPANQSTREAEDLALAGLAGAKRP